MFAYAGDGVFTPDTRRSPGRRRAGRLLRGLGCRRERPEDTAQPAERATHDDRGRDPMNLDDKTILITGGTGSFGKALIARILDEYEPTR